LIKNKLGISEETMKSMIGGGGGGGGGGGSAAPVAAEPVKEKDVFDIKLTVVDPKSKIKTIKEVRALTGLGLKEVILSKFGHMYR
jgi:ribosomal protein L7/L12